MIELVFAFLAAVGVLDSRTADEPVEVDLRPAYSEVVCFVECFDYCIWPVEVRP